jgi:hypothetical protein
LSTGTETNSEGAAIQSSKRAEFGFPFIANGEIARQPSWRNEEAANSQALAFGFRRGVA